MPQAFVHGTTSIAVSFMAGPAVPIMIYNHRSHVCFSRYCIPSPSSSVSLYLSRIVKSMACRVDARFIRKSREMMTRRGTKKRAPTAHKIGELRKYVRQYGEDARTHPEGWVMVQMARGTRVRKLVW
jgi:hypothetical protein